MLTRLLILAAIAGLTLTAVTGFGTDSVLADEGAGYTHHSGGCLFKDDPF